MKLIPVLETDRFSHPDRLAQYLGQRFDWDEDFNLMPGAEQLERHQRERDAFGGMGAGTSNVVEREKFLKKAAKNEQLFQLTAKTGGVMLRCVVNLDQADGAIYVDKYGYRLWGTRHDAKGRPTNPTRSEATVPTKSWSDTPD